MDNPLDRLLVDKNELDKEQLTECIAGLVGIDRDTGSVVLLSSFERLSSAKHRVLAYLLGRKAAVLLKKAEEEGAGPTEISEDLGIPMGTVGRTVRELAEDRLVSQGDDKKYTVASHQLPSAQRTLEKGRKSED